MPDYRGLVGPPRRTFRNNEEDKLMSNLKEASIINLSRNINVFQHKSSHIVPSSGEYDDANHGKRGE